MTYGNGYWRGYPSHLRSRGAKSAHDSCENSLHNHDQGQNEVSGKSQDQGRQYWETCNKASRQPVSGQQAPHPQMYTPTKSHVTAGLLAIFLGCFGIHKFYLGYNAVGFVMLAVTVLGSICTFGLAGGVMMIIGLVEGIIYLMTGQQAFERSYVNGKKEWF